MDGFIGLHVTLTEVSWNCETELAIWIIDFLVFQINSYNICDVRLQGNIGRYVIVFAVPSK